MGNYGNMVKMNATMNNNNNNNNNDNDNNNDNSNDNNNDINKNNNDNYLVTTKWSHRMDPRNSRFPLLSFFPSLH